VKVEIFRIFRAGELIREFDKPIPMVGQVRQVGDSLKVTLPKHVKAILMDLHDDDNLIVNIEKQKIKSLFQNYSSDVPGDDITGGYTTYFNGFIIKFVLKNSQTYTFHTHFFCLEK